MSISANCILGIIFIVVGLLLRFYPPTHINNSLGYKTPFSRKNKDTWYEGNRFSGKILFIGGLIFIPFSILIKYLYSNNSTLSMKISLFAAFIIAMVAIIYTEIHLRITFDKNGVKKSH